MTEHSSVVFVFFFLAEYTSIVIICNISSLIFLGGYLNIMSFSSILNIFEDIFNYIYGYLNYYLISNINNNMVFNNIINNNISLNHYNIELSNLLFNINYINTFYISKNLLYSQNIGFKTSILIFIFF